MSSPAETAERFYALLDAEDVEGLLALCSEEVEVLYPAAEFLPYGGLWKGHGGIAQFLDAHDAAEEIIVFEPDAMVAEDDIVVAIGNFTGRAKPGGIEWSTRFAHRLTTRDGLLLGWEAYFDTAAALRAHRSEASVATLEAITDAFNRHDLDAIMSFFAEDAVFESPRGSDPWGRRFEAKDAVRAGLAERFSGIPNVHYADGDHFVAGDRGASEWTLTGTTTGGETIEVRGCDLWTFRDGLVTRKDSYWKIRSAP